MSGIQVTLPLQIICQLLAAAQVSQNVTMPSTPKPALVNTETPHPPILPFGYVAFPEYGMAYKIFNVEMTQNQARKMCLSEDGQLAVIDSKEKIAKIVDNFSSFSAAWVGLGKYLDTEEWATIDGKPANNLPWESSEPTGGGKCVRLSKNYNGLGNYSCDNKYPYLCEIALRSN